MAGVAVAVGRASAWLWAAVGCGQLAVELPVGGPQTGDDGHQSDDGGQFHQQQRPVGQSSPQRARPGRGQCGFHGRGIGFGRGATLIGHDDAPLGPGAAPALLALGVPPGDEQLLQLGGVQFFGRSLAGHGVIIVREGRNYESGMKRRASRQDRQGR